MMTNQIPQTYEAWRHCIEVECGIPLTRDYIASRLSVLRESSAEETQRFVQRYGRLHWQKVVAWFETAAEQVAGRES
jgi:hypothetical protein